MAKQVINIGTTANDGTGDPLRSAFDKVNDNFTELYTDDAGDVNSVNAGTGITVNSTTGAVTVTNSLPNATHSGDVTGSAALTIAADAVTYAKMQNLATGDRVLGATSAGVIGEVQIVPDMIADDAVTTDKINNDAVTTDKLANSINTAITANTAKTGISSAQTNAITANTSKTTNATHSGEVTGSGALTIANNAVTTVKILNDNITHDKLENRFTAVVSVSNRSGATTIDWSAGAVFVMANSLNGAIEFDFTNFKTGQTIDIYNLTGAQTITFDSNAGTSETFNKCGAVDYAGGSTNLIQVQCVDDDATAVFNYAVSAYVSDATPS